MLASVVKTKVMLMDQCVCYGLVTVLVVLSDISNEALSFLFLFHARRRQVAKKGTASRRDVGWPSKQFIGHASLVRADVCPKKTIQCVMLQSKMHIYLAPIIKCATRKLIAMKPLTLKHHSIYLQ